MLVGLSTAHLLLPHATVADALAALAAAEPAAVEVAAGGPEPLQLALLGALQARRDTLPLRALEAYAPGGRSSAGPGLAALDGGERAAAVQQATRSIRAAAELGIEVVVLALGRVDFDAEWPLLRARFARDELAPDWLAGKRAERAARCARHLDAARTGLDPLLRAAERAGVRLGVVNRPGYDEIPDALEIAAVLADFRGAPLGTFYDPAAARVQEAVGTTDPGAPLAAFGPTALGAHLTDAAGFARGLPPGLGEVEFAALRDQLPATAPLFVHCAPGAFAREVATALAAMRACLG